MAKFLLFTTGGGSADPLNWSSDEAALYSTDELKGMKPSSSRSIDLFFETTYGKEVVTLGIKNSTHSAVMGSIATALNSNQATVTIADVDGSIFCSPHIISVDITSQETHCQTLTASTKTKINIERSNYSSCLVTNMHSSAVTLDLYLAAQVGGVRGRDRGDLYPTLTRVNNGSGYAATTGAVDVVVDGTTATDDLFLNERVYNYVSGVFIGTCTAVGSGTSLTFGGGIEIALTDDDALATGKRYNLLKSLSIPTASTLKLESDEISFDNSIFDLYAVSNHAQGLLTFTFNY